MKKEEEVIIKKVIPTFECEVLGAKRTDYINDILIKMGEKSFSQIPVVNDNWQVTELINTNTISRWASEKLKKFDTIVIDKVKVEELISKIEFKKNYKFISRNTSVYDAFHMFLKHIKDERRYLDVLFITDSGESTEKLLGLITIDDIANNEDIKLLKCHKNLQ